MRASLVCVFACCVVFPAAASSSGPPDKSEKIPVDVGDRAPDGWPGHQHYLFDMTYPAPQTTDGLNSEENLDACAPLVLRRTDGVTIARRPRGCPE
jgi:hypothetical protein